MIEPDWGNPENWDANTRDAARNVMDAARVALSGYVRNGWRIGAFGPGVEGFFRCIGVPVIDPMLGGKWVYLVRGDGDPVNIHDSMNIIRFWPTVEVTHVVGMRGGVVDEALK